MYKLFLKLAARFLLKNGMYSFINIFGLAIGIASFLLIMLYVDYEKSYDKFQGSENVYRVYMDYTEDGVFVPGDAQTYNSSGPTLKEAFPDIKEFVRLYHMNNVIFKYNSTVFDGEKGALADPSVFEVLQYRLLKGNIETVLKEPYSILLTESLAKKIFGDENPIGKSLSVIFNGNTVFTVKGVLQDPVVNTHIKNNFLISFNTIATWKGYPNNKELNWNTNTFFTYVKVDKKADAERLRNKIMGFKIESLPHERHNLEPLEDIHLHSDKPYEAEANGSASRVNFLLAIAFIIIVLSWLNYVNLSTTKSLERAKETGIRKVVGAQRPQIIVQSLIESFVLNGIALIVAFGVVLIILPTFNNYINKELVIEISSIKSFMPLLSFLLLGAAISGMYPALILSKYPPAKALKGKILTSGTGLMVRKGLIIGQFLATIALLMGTIVVTKQIKFLQNQPIGAELNQIIAVNGTLLDERGDSLRLKNFRTLTNELQKIAFVKEVTTSQTYPGGSYESLSSTVGITFPNGIRDDKRVWYHYTAQPEYFELMGMEFLAGGPFLSNPKDNGKMVVLNERFVKHMGISQPSEAINKTVEFWGQKRIISGVIKDYHHFGLKTIIEPIMIRYASNSRNLLIKLNQKALSVSNVSIAIAQIESTWKEVFPQSTFNYTFLDQNFAAQYNEDKAFGTAFQIFTLLAILIASLGLFGLTSYTCLQRKKEIGVRKVNGATIAQILQLLNQDFVKWVGLAFVMAIPVSSFAMHKWLEGFAYKTDISWWIFILAGTSALVIALISVSWQSFRAAIANPIEVLRNE